ncbi:MAG: hypothetical protein RR505_12535, partial [Raoultibacter sp.]
AFVDWQDAHPQLVDQNGKPLSELCEYQINNLAEGKSLELSLIFLPTDAKEAFIAPAIFTDSNEWMGDMTKAVQIK